MESLLREVVHLAKSTNKTDFEYLVHNPNVCENEFDKNVISTFKNNFGDYTYQTIDDIYTMIGGGIGTIIRQGLKRASKLKGLKSVAKKVSKKAKKISKKVKNSYKSAAKLISGSKQHMAELLKGEFSGEDLKLLMGPINDKVIAHLNKKFERKLAKLIVIYGALNGVQLKVKDIDVQPVIEAIAQTISGTDETDGNTE